MLYPIKKSFAIHEMKRDEHTLYFEEYGKRNGIPVIFLHGGPGSGCGEWQKSLFNSRIYRVIFLDQRGSGKSIPKRLLKNNTLAHLIDDLEHIRRFLKINTWFIVGGSWGSTLAIAYGEKYAKHVSGMVLRSLFLGTDVEVDWAFRKAPITFKPFLIRELNKILGNNPDQSPIKKLGKMLTSKSLKDICIAAELWQEYEKNLSSVRSKNFDFKSILEKKTSLHLRIKTIPNTPFMENYYIKNNFFLHKGQLMENRKVLKDVPISVIQGGYDLLCPPINSFLFSQGLPKLKVIQAYAAGHYISDPEVKELMKKEIDELQNL